MKKCLIATVLLSSLLLPEEYVEYTFTYFSNTAQQVQIEGDFTGWLKIPLEKMGNRWAKTFKIKKARAYEYRFIVDGNPELDPNNKNKSEISNTSILYLDKEAKNEPLNKKNANINFLLLTIKELSNTQKQFLEELKLLREEFVKKDLQIELLRTQLDKMKMEKKEDEQVCKHLQAQNDELNKKFETIEKETKKLREENERYKKEYNIMQDNYLRCIKKHALLKEKLKNTRIKQKNLTKSLNKTMETQAKINESRVEENQTKEEVKVSYTKVGKIYGISATTNLLVIYIGENSDLAKGDVLYTLKDNKVKATLMITSVEKEWCYAKIISGDKNDVGKEEVYKIVTPTPSNK
ncbi:MAG: hypothetical protein ACK4NF_03620 [Planctomycetota bacterium]